MLPEVLMSLVVEASDGSFFGDWDHEFDLAIGLGGFGLGEPVVYFDLGAGELEDRGAEEFSAFEREFDLSRSRIYCIRCRAPKQPAGDMEE